MTIKTKKAKNPKVLYLDIEKWRCGGMLATAKNGCYLGKGPTDLANDSGFFCCLGFFSLQCNVPSDYIFEVLTPGDISDEISVPRFLRMKGGDSKFSTKAIRINDAENTTVAQKIYKLKVLCRKYNKKLVLKNATNDLKKEVRRLEAKRH